MCWPIIVCVCVCVCVCVQQWWNNNNNKVRPKSSEKILYKWQSFPYKSHMTGRDLTSVSVVRPRSYRKHCDMATSQILMLAARNILPLSHQMLTINMDLTGRYFSNVVVKTVFLYVDVDKFETGEMRWTLGELGSTLLSLVCTNGIFKGQTQQFSYCFCLAERALYFISLVCTANFMRFTPTSSLSDAIHAFLTVSKT
jgi:hypothetical protein